MRNVVADVKFALRSFGKSPIFTTVAILSLALGIGANTAIFSLINQLILKPLPIRDPQSVVLLKGVGRHYGSNNGRNALSYPMYQDIRDRNTVFSGMMCRYSVTATIGVTSHAEAANTELVSGNYFPMLGIGAAVGRVFTPGDDLYAGANPYAVLSYAYWKSHFAGDSRIVGQSLRYNNYPLTIIGVAQAGFDGMEPGLPAGIFIPVTMAGQVRPGFTDMYNRRQRWINVFGRLKPGVTTERAKAALQPLLHQIIDLEVLDGAFRNASPDAKRQFLNMSLDLLPGSQGNSFLRRQYDTALLVLMCVVAFVLLIACANLASLLTARGAARQKEIAVRLALGSSRGRLVQQLLTESLLLSIAGASLGVGLAVLIVKGLLGFLPINISGYSISSMPDGEVLAFTAGIALLAGIAFGLIPALQSTRPAIAPVLKDQAGSVTGGGAQIGFRKLLVAGQITLSLVLLIGAGLFIRSLAGLELLNPGFRTKGLVQFTLNPRFAGYQMDRTAAFFEQLTERLRAIPGVRSAGSADMAILNGNEWDQWVTVEGYRPPNGQPPDPHFNAITPGYLEAMDIHVLNGRAFTPRDTESAPKVAIVNAKFAKLFFAGSVPVGRHIGLGGDPGTPTDVEIVGMINDTRYEDLREEIPPQVFLCELQRPAYGSRVTYVLTDRDAAGTFDAIRTVVRDLDPNMPVVNMKSFDRQLGESLVTERLIATLSTVFGVLATGLVLIGLYGTMTFMVTRRSREIGIRMALGAMSGNVVWLVMREVMLLIGAGIVVGLPVSLALNRLVQSQLYGTTPGDPVSIGFATMLLAVVSAAAGYLPARRAAASDPLRILRYE
ncbi:MAG TPA: ABC transporter permease [Bryobacteraceae bacterium]|nr:ABC transporter permease [Bryobacteraceae bacterium]